MALFKALYFFTAAAGLLLSLGSIYLEHKKHKDEKYTAFCDINDRYSCTAVLTSEYSIGMGLVGPLLGEDHVLNVPNTYFGVFFYALMIILGLFPQTPTTVLIILSTLSLTTSLYLLYVMLYVMEKVCLMCMAVHITNFVLWVLCITADRQRTNKKKVN